MTEDTSVGVVVSVGRRVPGGITIWGAAWVAKAVGIGRLPQPASSRLADRVRLIRIRV